MSNHTTAPAVVAPILDEYVIEQARLRARELTEKSHLPPDQCEDIQQDMIVALLKASKRFDPAKAGMHTFACRVMDGFSKDFIRRLVSKRRRGHLDVPCTDLADDFSLDRQAVGDGILRDLVREETSQAVRGVLDELPEDLRPVCEAMFYTKDRKAIAEQLGISRSSLYRRIQRIQAHFRAAGVEPEGIASKAAGHIRATRGSKRVKKETR
ncbi:MAG: sigma-70 family RNA polymerase sigma factor [Planctomycetota bacterium]|nr:sigma-70 family RNA polymerase sigma factor [Planctomycetota bacterium]